MAKEREYFHIELEHLKGETLFPFHLYVYNPTSKKYSPYIYANSPLDEEKIEFIKFIIDKKGSLAILSNQRKTFLRNFEYKEEDIPDLSGGKELTEEEKIRETNKKTLQLEDEKRNFKFNEMFLYCLEKDNFMPLIKRAKREITCFSLRKSHTVSLASYLVEKLMDHDTLENRIVAVSYFFAKTFKIEHESDLSDLICAGFLHHIGLTQMEMSISKTSQKKLEYEEQRQFKKHPGLSHHLIRKSKVDLTDRCQLIITQHHERTDGNGFPSALHESGIDFLSLILGSISFLFEYSGGLINGNTQSIEATIRAMKNKNFTPGLEFGFGDKILVTLDSLVTKDEAA